MNWNRGHSPPFQGGVAARLQEMAQFLDWRSRGGSNPTHNHLGRSLGSRPPLLSKEGNSFDSTFIHTFIDRAYNLTPPTAPKTSVSLPDRHKTIGLDIFEFLRLAA